MQHVASQAQERPQGELGRHLLRRNARGDLVIVTFFLFQHACSLMGTTAAARERAVPVWLQIPGRMEPLLLASDLQQEEGAAPLPQTPLLVDNTRPEPLSCWLLLCPS